LRDRPQRQGQAQLRRSPGWGQCITSVVQLANIPGEAEVVSTSKADAIKAPADFEGRNLGITSLGSSTDFLTQALAGQAGVKSYTPAKARPSSPPWTTTASTRA
jgi:TRAP-type uncharacterized transport system substrate-binding protein